MLNSLTKLREEREDGDRGFTLIELLVVVVIIGILIAIAIPLYLNYKKGANDKSAESDLRGAVAVMEQCQSDNGSYPATADVPAGGGAVTSSCTGQINASSGTSFSYASDGTNFVMWSTNSNGSGNQYYCYASGGGGTVGNVAGKTALPTASVATGCA